MAPQIPKNCGQNCEKSKNRRKSLCAPLRIGSWESWRKFHRSGMKEGQKEAGQQRRRRRPTIWPLRGSSSIFSPWSRRGLNPIKPVYDPDQPDGRLSLAASAFNQLGQCTSSPGRRGYCYAKLAVFFPIGGRNHRQYSLRLPTGGWPGWVGLGGWLRQQLS